MWRIGLLVILWGAWGCGEKPDELGPYVHRLSGLQHHYETLLQYDKYLHTEGMTTQANDIAEVLKAFRRDIEKLGAPEDKRILALHNEMLRSFDEALRKLVEPEFPTFVPNAQRSVRIVLDEMQAARHHFLRLWERAGKTEEFPLQFLPPGGGAAAAPAEAAAGESRP